MPDWDRIILAHSKWKRELSRALENEEKLDADKIGKDSLCELGTWIYAEGAAFGNLPAYVDLKQKHARFHAVVAKIVHLAKALPRDKVRELIDPLNSDFGRATAECINAIEVLKTSVH